jgi:hypothetical protein
MSISQLFPANFGKRGSILRKHRPESLGFDRAIIMHNDVSHRIDRRPVNVRVARFECGAQFGGQFADDGQPERCQVDLVNVAKKSTQLNRLEPPPQMTNHLHDQLQLVKILTAHSSLYKGSSLAPNRRSKARRSKKSTLCPINSSSRNCTRAWSIRLKFSFASSATSKARSMSDSSSASPRACEPNRYNADMPAARNSGPARSIVDLIAF